MNNKPIQHIRHSKYITLRSDESGIAYGAGIVVIGLVFFGIILIFLTYPMDLFVDEFNIIVSNEPISSDTTNAFGFCMLVLKGVGLLLLIGFAIWGINRAILVKTGGE